MKMKYDQPWQISHKQEFPKPEDFIKKLEAMGLPDQANAYQKVVELAEAVKKEKGRALLVGGCVRDFLMGKISKDFDMEVYGLESEQIEIAVSKVGKVSEVGKAFGILKIGLQGGMDIDVSLPRTDSKTGVGHKGFAVKTDPNMSVEEAAKRRDFTMNSIAADPLTGKIHDPYNGVEDIKNRMLRITDIERFKDDPLRVLRAIQFIGRFGLRVHPDSVPTLQEMSLLLKELPKERIGDEWKKLLLKSDKPSLGLIVGMNLGIFEQIHPEFPPLTKTPQEPEWHPEGDAWIHTLMSVDEAAKIVKREQLDQAKSLIIILSALCHDLGKPMVTELKDGKIKSHGHEKAGVEPTQNFLASLGMDNLTRNKVVKLVANHMIPSMFYIQDQVHGNPITDGAIRRLAKRISPATIQELVLVSEADHMGRGPFDDPEIKEQLVISDKEFSPGVWLLEKARKLAVEDSKPADLTRGRDWINFGFKPGAHIGMLIGLANDLRDDKDYTREKVFQAVAGAETPDQAVKILQNLLK